MDEWNIERHLQSLSQLHSRVLPTHFSHVVQGSHSHSHAVKFSQTTQSSLMDSFQNGEFGVDMDSDVLKKFEKLSLHGGGDAGTLGTGMGMERDIMSGFTNLSTNVDLNKLMTQGTFSGDDVSVSARSETTQMLTSSISSSTVQKEGSLVESVSMPTGSRWSSTKINAHKSDVQEELTGVASVATASGVVQSVKSNISIGTGSASAVAGVTRSFSTSSGFAFSPSPLANNQSHNSDKSSHALVENDLEIPSLHNFMPPFRRPFGFRNFDRPLWTDTSQAGDHLLNRMTWNPSTLQSQKISSGQVQFSATQRTLYCENGVLKKYEDKQILLRQSYGASESESEDDEDDDEVKYLRYQGKKAITFPSKSDKFEKPPCPPSEIDDTSSICTNEQELTPTGSLNGEIPSSPEHIRCHKVAQELLSTEKTYVKILHLIDQVFHFRVDQENRVQPMFPPDTVTQMFCNIKSLYQLHNDHLLPQLEKRLDEWKQDNPKIGDIMKGFAPFLKMYSEYVQNFDNSINLINLYKDKSTRFANIINEVQKMESCANLPIQHHLISPIQRIPRYRLLLEAYLRKLPESSPDRNDSLKALEIVSKAAEHANEAMRRIASFKKLLEVQEKVKGAVELVSPTRVLIKEGKVSKISARSSDHQERYIFLFSDTALLCSIRPMANRMISSAPYQLRAKLDVAELTVNEGDDLEVVNTFYIQDQNKRIELYTPTTDEKKAWMEAIWQARLDLMQRKSSLKLGSLSPSEEDLGLKQPAKIKADSVSKCMECGTQFTVLKRRHHCHACGSVVCAKCSGTKIPLQYAGGKSCRVCETCKKVLDRRESNAKDNSDSVPSSCSNISELTKGVLDVPASAHAVLNGCLSLRLRGKKVWNPRWFALREDFVFYCYATGSDEQAMTATPMPGMNVQLAENVPKSESLNLQPAERERVFRIADEHSRKVFLLLASNRVEAAAWVNVLQLATKAELNSTEKNPS